MNVHINTNCACVECKNVNGKNVNVCIVAVIVSLNILALMCIYVIYKCSSRGWRSAAGSRQAKLKTAKSSYCINGKLLSVLSHVVNEKDLVCFEKGARMESFAAVPQSQATQVRMRRCV
jgi:hypothetical protein